MLALLLDLAARVERETGNYGAAAALYREAIDLEPYNGLWVTFLGVTLRRLESEDEAEACFWKSLRHLVQLTTKPR